jgi:hypothetical protein
MRTLAAIAITLFLSLTAFAQNEEMTYYTYGLPAIERLNARDIVAERYGFYYRSIAGCVINEEMMDTVRPHNERIDKKLALRHGKNWRKKFDREVEAEYKRLKPLTQAVNEYLASEETAALDKQLGLTETYKNTWLTPSADGRSYEVVVSGLYGENFMELYTLSVDKKSKRVKLAAVNPSLEK